MGSGKALRLGANGDVDVLLVHAPTAEARFVAQGHGIDRTEVMANDFVILGPETGPAKVRATASAAHAFAAIERTRSPFISRGDDAGTHQMESALWKTAGLKPEGAWYASAGQGMGAVLRIADDKSAYTLNDRGTYLPQRDKIDLQVLSEGDPALLNPYRVIAINPQRHPHVKYELANTYIEYLTGSEAQARIGRFRIGGRPLFRPNARSVSPSPQAPFLKATPGNFGH